MTLLATNKATKRSKIWNVFDIVLACIWVPSILLLFFLSWKIYQETNSFSFGTFFCAAWALIVLYVVLVIIDNCLRWTLGVESVKVDNGMLVIDCEGSILRRHKEIPLSSNTQSKAVRQYRVYTRRISPGQTEGYLFRHSALSFRDVSWTIQAQRPRN